MFFHLQLFRIAVAARKKYLYWAIVPAVIYLIIAAMFPHSYEISQDLRARDEAKLAPGPSPMDLVSVQSVLSEPQSFFTTNQVLMDLREQLLTGDTLEREEWSQWMPSRFAVFIKRTVRNDLTLQSSDTNMLTLSYQGQDQKLGKFLVDFYAQRLVWAGQRAQKREALTSQSQGQNGDQDKAKSEISLAGELQIDSSRTLLTWERTVVALVILAACLVLALITIWLKETSRPKLYTERQAARYLDIPVLGSVPNLDRLLSGRR